MAEDIYRCKNPKCNRKHMPPCMDCIKDIRSDERILLSKLFALNHVPCDNQKCLCQTKEFEKYWKGAGIEKRTSNEAIASWLESERTWKLCKEADFKLPKMYSWQMFCEYLAAKLRGDKK